MKRLALVPALCALALVPACERLWVVSGTWVYRTGKFHIFILELEQAGKAITGTLCESDGLPLIVGAPVSGEFPHLTARIGPEHVAQYGQAKIGARLEAEVVSRDSIGAQLIYSTGHSAALGFQRDTRSGLPDTLAAHAC